MRKFDKTLTEMRKKYLEEDIDADIDADPQAKQVKKQLTNVTKKNNVAKLKKAKKDEVKLKKQAQNGSSL